MNEDVLSSFHELNRVSNEMRLISINARIEASKASDVEGRKFSVIAEEMSNSVNKINTSLEELRKKLEEA
jgi:methyl-accepting chemotaxis protein